MKKVLLAFDGPHFSEGAFEFARMLNEKSKILLTGAFLPQVDYANLWSYSGGGVSGPLYVPLLENEDAEVIQQNIERFSALCQENGIDYTVHKDFYDFALSELKKETRFADLLILGSETFYQSLGTGSPNDYLENALHGVECATIVVPEKFRFPDSNVLAYDGSASSAYAIKQFACLLPELAGNSTILVYATAKDKNVPDIISIEELAARHFPDLTIQKLGADPRNDFNTWLLDQRSAILISGSFGRSDLSRMFRKSFVAAIIREHRLPIFISHCA